MKTWEYSTKDGATIDVRHAVPADARKLHGGFDEVIQEGIWLPTFNANSNIADWVNWIQRTNQCRDIMLVAEIDDEYTGHLTLQTEEWMASRHVAKLGIIVSKKDRGRGIGRALMLAAEDAALDFSNRRSDVNHPGDWPDDARGGAIQRSCASIDFEK